MSWEIITTKVSNFPASENDNNIRKIFQEQTEPWISSKNGEVHAEKYLSLSSSELVSHYHKEIACSYRFGNNIYCLPMSMVIDGNQVSNDLTQSIKIVAESSKYSVDDNIEIFVDSLIKKLNSKKNKHLHNGKVASLRSIETDKNNNYMLTVSKGSYYDSLATNFAMDHEFTQANSTLRETISGLSGKLGVFNHSPLVNHIGVVLLVETSDGMLVVQQRSAKVAIRTNSLSASVAGAVDWLDISKYGSLEKDNAIVDAVCREAFEELGLELNEIRFLGLLREFLRGGKPEFYFFAKIKQKFPEVVELRKTAADKQETYNITPYEFHSNLLDGTDLENKAFYNRVINILEAVGPEANLTLVASICLVANSFI